MTTVELQKRSEKSQNLRVIQVDETWFYVESDEGKICYKVCYAAEDQYSCTCGDFARGIKNDQNFKYKHILAVASCVPNGEQEKAQFLRKCAPSIQQMNLNYWIWHEKNDELFFRFDGDEIRAVFTPRYIPTDNLEVLDRLMGLGFKPETRVQSSLDNEFMLVSIPDEKETFKINGDKMTPGISVSNSEVGLAALSISTFTLRLVCTNGMISKTEVSASYRHVSDMFLSNLPGVLNELKAGFGQQREQFRISLESKVESPEATIASFNRQFELRKEEKEAVEWALAQEYGFTMFSVVNTYTKAAQYELLSAESRFRLQKVGGMILGLAN